MQTSSRRLITTPVIKKVFQNKPMHWLLLLVLLIAAIPAAVLACGIILPVKMAFKAKAILGGKWLFF